jgi:hypothetical protein
MPGMPGTSGSGSSPGSVNRTWRGRADMSSMAASMVASVASQPRASEPAFSVPILSARLGVRRESAATMSPSLT